MLSKFFGKRESALPQWPPFSKIGGIGSDSASKQAFLGSVFTMLSTVMSADGDAVRQHHDAIREFMRETLKLRSNEELYAMGVFLRPNKTEMSFEDATTTFYHVVDGQKKLLRCMTSTLIHFAMLNSGYTENKRKLIELARRNFDLATREFQSLSQERVTETLKQREQDQTDEETLAEGRQRIRQMLRANAATELERAYKLFNVKSDVSTEAIRELYRKLVVEFHPDRVAPDEKTAAKIEEARKRFQTILHAYRTIMKERKEKKA